MYIEDFKEKDEDDQQQVAHARARTHTHTHTLSHSLTHSLSLTHSHTRARARVAQVYYMPGLRAEKEITRARIVNYIEDIFGEQMSEQERNRILPRTDEDDEMQDE